jgi:hypothetical protein
MPSKEYRMQEEETYTFSLPPTDPDVEAQVEAVRARGECPVIEYGSDGTVTVTGFSISPELEDSLARAQAEWKRLEEAGTPYWCVHEDRSVTHSAAYWKNDTPDDPIHRKHGVMCRECGGYIQEG